MTTEYTLAVVAVVVVVAVVLAAMARSWRRKVEASSQELPPPPAVPQDLGTARTVPMEGSYVSTTRAGDWLARVPGHGLGTRSPAVVQVHDAGVVITRTGAPDVFVPAADVVSAFRSGGMTGKYTGGSGLVVMRWRLHDRTDRSADRSAEHAIELDTGLHLRHAADREALTDAVSALAPTTTEETS
jgi:hypothetical protein